ncbi:MAG TPA: hypothetical protein VE650_04265 [Acetobacteraceae bacterium]|jgi:cell division inhibitor SulA|nr:hypothetical protein [Acetobacteraceae bacterium]
MQHFDRKRGSGSENEAAPLDPVALTLALWLGIVVAVTGLIRLSETAAANAARAAQEQRGAAFVMRPLGQTFAPNGS